MGVRVLQVVFRNDLDDFFFVKHRASNLQTISLAKLPPSPESAATWRKACLEYSIFTMNEDCVEYDWHRRCLARAEGVSVFLLWSFEVRGISGMWYKSEWPSGSWACLAFFPSMWHLGSLPLDIFSVLCPSSFGGRVGGKWMIYFLDFKEGIQNVT